MPLQLRRGSNTARETTVFAAGEPVWTTDTTQLYVGDGVTPGGVLVAGGGSASTNTFVNATIDTELSIGTGTYRMLLGQSPGEYSNQFYITGNAEVNDKLFFDNFNLVQINPGNQLQVESTATFNGGVAINNTLTMANLTIGANDTNISIPNVLINSATTVLFQTNPVSGGNIIFNMNRFGVQRPLAITRTGGIAFDFGQQISPGQGANVGQLLVQAASTSTGTANTLFLSSGGITGSGPLSRGVFSDASGFTVGTRPSGGATAFNSSVFDLNGGLTLPNSLVVGTTATVATLKFGDGTTMTTAASGSGGSTSTYYNLTATNELRVGAEDGLGQLRFYRDGTNGHVIANTDAGNDYLTVANQRWIFLNPTTPDGSPGDSCAVIINEANPAYSVLRVNKITPISTYTNVEIASSLSVSNTATVTTLKFGDGTTMTTAPNQSLNTTNDVTFANANITTRIDTSQIYANATTQDLSLTANFNGAGSGAGGSVNIFSAGGSQAGANVEVLGDIINFKSADSSVNYGGFDFDNGLTVSTTATVGALRFGTETAITSRSELIGPTGPAGSTGTTGPTGPAGDYSGTERVYAFGNTSGTIAPDATSATIFTMTLNGNLTLNALTNVVTGSNATFVITQDGTGGRTLTSSWKFAGGAKTLTTSGTATDMISVFYDGSNYYASLSRGFV
jgi:hypothetical protein